MKIQVAKFQHFRFVSNFDIRTRVNTRVEVDVLTRDRVIIDQKT